MRLVIATLAVTVVSLGGCGKTEDHPPKPGVAATPGGYTVTGKDGAVATVITGGTASAANLPDFAPLYPGGAIEGTITGVGKPDAKVSGGTATFTTSATPGQVIDFYKQKTAAAGLATEMNANMGAALMLVAQDKATDRGLQVMASNQGGATSVTLIWAMPK